MQKKKNVTRYGDDEAWISKLVPGCSSVAAERLKHHTVFFTALYWLVSSLAHSWTDFLFFFFYARWHEQLLPLLLNEWKRHRLPSKFADLTPDSKYQLQWPTLSATVVGCISVSLSSWQSNASSSERLTLKAAYSTHIYICCLAGTSSGRFDYYSSKGGSHVK